MYSILLAMKNFRKKMYKEKYILSLGQLSLSILSSLNTLIVF